MSKKFSNLIGAKLLSLANLPVVALSAAMCFAVSPNGAIADEMIAKCDTEMVGTVGEIACDFRFTELQVLEELTLSANGQTLENSSFTPYAGTGAKTAWFFLIDRSNPRRATTVKRNVDIVRDQLRFASGTRLVGLGTFANDLDVIYEPTQSHEAVDATLDGITANGAATEFFSNSLEAIKILEGVDAARKALVIMSDGKAEDTAYTRADVVNAANAAGISIFGLGFAEAATETPALQEIRRLAEETNGYFAAVVGDQPFAADFLSNLPRYLENGGTVRAPIGDLSGETEMLVAAKLQGGRTISASETVELVAQITEEAVQTELSLISKIYRAFDGVFSGASTWANENGLLAWLPVILFPLGLLILGVLLMRGGKAIADDAVDFDVDVAMSDIDDVSTGVLTADDFEMPDEMTRHVQAGASAFGHFEIVGNEDKRFPISGQSISIGRHSDNDLQLANDSVHRHHAHFRISPEGAPIIHDLDTANGLLVNGSRVKTANLSNGDVVELGEVRLRYIEGS